MNDDQQTPNIPTPTNSQPQPSPQPAPVVPTPQASTPSTQPTPDVYAAALKSIHSTGTWTIVLGVIYVIATPLATVYLGNQTSSVATSKVGLAIAGLVVGLIMGGILAWLGIKLRKTSQDTVLQAQKPLLWLMLILAIIALLGLLLGGGAGLINFLLLFVAGRALNKLQKVKKATAVA